MVQRWPRGERNELHFAAARSADQIVRLLSTGFNIDLGDPDGFTPLMISSLNGYSRAVKILLSKGANVEVPNVEAFTALHLAALGGYLIVTKMLVEAGADLGATTSTRNSTPLHLAAENGHWGVVRMLIKAGANPNSRMLDGETPLFMAADKGHVQAVKELLRAKADPLLVITYLDGDTFTPLDITSENGHLRVVRELLQEFGLERCGGDTDGVDALDAAAKEQHLGIMAALLDAGVVDSGMALATAGRQGSERAVKLLLERPPGKTADGASYVDNKYNACDYTPLLLSIAYCQPGTRRIVRLLIEAGADTSAAVCVTNAPGGPPWFNDTPLAYTQYCLREKVVGGEHASEEQLNSLEGIRRLLMRVEAVHAVSWLWRNDAPRIRRAPGDAGKAYAATEPGTSLGMMLPLMRRRARRRGMPLAALFRCSSKP